MNQEEFDELPVGTVLIDESYTGYPMFTIDVKIDNNRTLVVWDEEYENSFVEREFEWALYLPKCLTLAPAWMQELFKN